MASDPTYRLEIVVLPEAAQFYPAVGTVENLTDDNAGYDVKIVNKEVPRPVAALAPLGIKARMIKCTVLPNGERLEQGSHYTLEPRSSIFKTSFVMANSRGIIDKSYRGELKAPMKEGEMIGRRRVREWDPETGLKRTWHETLDGNENIRIVRPETNDGIKTHYIFDDEGNFIGTR